MVHKRARASQNGRVETEIVATANRLIWRRRDITEKRRRDRFTFFSDSFP